MFPTPAFWKALRRPPRGEALEAFQARHLADLVALAWHGSPYYRQLYEKAGVHPRHVRSPGDLQRLPVPRREVFRQDLERVLLRGVDLARMHRVYTSGSTGRPQVIPSTPAESRFERLSVGAALASRGLRPWHRLTRFRPADQIPRNARWLRYAPFPRRYVHVETPSQAKVDHLLRERPHALWAWPSVLSELALALEARNRSYPCHRVFSGGSRLDPQVRRRVQQRLGPQVLDLYAAWETSIVAMEHRPGGGLYGFPHLVIPEILDEKGEPAERGQVCCTVLWRRALPLIRYPLGDVASWRRPPRPGGVPVLQKLEGRVVGLMPRPDGGWMSEFAFVVYFKGTPGVRRFQIVEETPGSFAVRFEPGPSFRPGPARERLARIRSAYPAFRFRLDLHTPLVHSEGAKYRTVTPLPRSAGSPPPEAP